MASFEEHIKQAQNNLAFLSSINQQIDSCVDWQVTVCFYTALHLVNAHLSHFGLQYRKHHDVNFALNPDKIASISKIPEDEFDAYIVLQSLSRRSRYLVNDKELNKPTAAFTSEKHFAKAIRNLEKLIAFFGKKYSVSFVKHRIKCPSLRADDNLQYFALV